MLSGRLLFAPDFLIPSGEIVLRNVLPIAIYTPALFWRRFSIIIEQSGLGLVPSFFLKALYPFVDRRASCKSPKTPFDKLRVNGV